MRDFKGMKRQRGRNRGGAGGQSGGGGKPQQNANRAFDSNGPDNIKVRGHAQHVFEKYQQLARDATSSGDRVLAENFLQHAEHYFRVLRTLQPNRPASDFIARDNFASGYDIDFEDEAGNQAIADEQAAADAQSSETQGEGSEQSRGDYQQRDTRDQQSRDQQGQGQREGRWENRQDRNRDGQQGQQRDGQQRDGQQGQQRNRYDRDRAPREDRPYRSESQDGGESQPQQPQQREDRPREDRPREDRTREDRPREDRGGYRDRDRNYRDDRAPRDNGQQNAQREDRTQGDQPREDRPSRRERGDYQPRSERSADPLAVVEPQAQPLTLEAAPAAIPTPAPVAETTRMLRSSDGETSHAPAFLQAAAAPAPTSDEAPVKRPRGRPRKVKEEPAE
jgi:hypothetical protein